LSYIHHIEWCKNIKKNPEIKMNLY